MLISEVFCRQKSQGSWQELGVKGSVASVGWDFFLVAAEVVHSQGLQAASVSLPVGRRLFFRLVDTFPWALLMGGLSGHPLTFLSCPDSHTRSLGITFLSDGCPLSPFIFSFPAKLHPGTFLWDQANHCYRNNGTYSQVCVFETKIKLAAVYI